MFDSIAVLSEPRRREILQLVWNEERSAGEIARMFDVTFGAVSQHLKVLRDAGVVSQRREGRHIFYRAKRDALGLLAEYLDAMWSDRLTELKTRAEALQREVDRGNTE